MITTERASFEWEIPVKGFALILLGPPNNLGDVFNHGILHGMLGRWVVKDYGVERVTPGLSGLVGSDGTIKDWTDPDVYHESREAAEEILALRLLVNAS